MSEQYRPHVESAYDPSKDQEYRDKLIAATETEIREREIDAVVTWSEDSAPGRAGVGLRREVSPGEWVRIAITINLPPPHSDNGFVFAARQLCDHFEEQCKGKAAAA